MINFVANTTIMNFSRAFFLSIISVALLVSCAAPCPDLATEPDVEAKPLSEYTVQAIIYQQYASEYKALCYQAYNAAELSLKAKLAEGVDKPAIITDLDETVVDNSYYNAWLVNNNELYTSDTWKKWTAESKATAVPGSVAFFNWADSMGVTIFYVSNRKVDEHDATVKNMQALGYPQLDSTHFFLKTTTSGKEERRQTIYAQGYNVLLYLGDNLNDFEAGFEKLGNEERSSLTAEKKDLFGDRYIVFPNIMYGEWEGALYNFDRSLTPEQSDSIRKASLKGF